MHRQEFHTTEVLAELRRGAGVLAVLLAAVMAAATLSPTPASRGCGSCSFPSEPSAS